MKVVNILPRHSNEALIYYNVHKYKEKSKQSNMKMREITTTCIL